MGFNDNHYTLRVTDSRTDDGMSSAGDITSNVYVRIFDAGTKTAATIYSDDQRTAKTNPISRSQFGTDGGIDFYSSALTVDIFYGDELGNSAFLAGVSLNDHTLPLDKASVRKHLLIPFSSATSAEADSGIDIPYGSIVRDCAVEVTTVDTGETMDVGLLSTESNGDANGYLSAVDIGTLGLVRGIAVTAGTTETYISTMSYGALIGPGVVGTNAADDFGLATLPGHAVIGSAAQSVSYQASAGATTGSGVIHVWFEQYN